MKGKGKGVVDSMKGKEKEVVDSSNSKYMKL